MRETGKGKEKNKVIPRKSGAKTGEKNFKGQSGTDTLVFFRLCARKGQTSGVVNSVTLLCVLVWLFLLLSFRVDVECGRGDYDIDDPVLINICRCPGTDAWRL